MRNLLYLLIACITIQCSNNSPSFKTAQISLIPKPVDFKLAEGSFEITSSTHISVSNQQQQMAAQYLTDLFKKAAGFNLNIQENSNGSIVFESVKGLKPEAYQLCVTPREIRIKASDAAGYFYGVQTLRQLLPVAIESETVTTEKWLVPSVNIKDQPRFKWRGMQMDVSRHFFSVDNVKTFLDYMALYKMNTYHMHLTDDQGWRIEIKKYPLLTEKGAWRIESKHDIQCKELAKTNPMFTIDPQHYHDKDGQKMYGGFYTQDQIKEIVAYAANLNITVIPEIDMPGHFKSAIDNYPYLSCTNEAGWGDLFSSPACLGKETSYTFIKDVLAEVVELFPGDYVHIGGDEVNIKSWKACANCQKTIKKNNLKNEHELQSFFNADIERFLNSKGKKMIGWDEIVTGGMSKNTTIMWWRNWAPKARYIASDNNSDIIICPDFEYYFDFTNEATPLKKVYNYEPVPEDFTPEQEQHIIGVQANLWSERIPNFKRLQYQAFPRMLALAESAWAKGTKNFEEFSKRLSTHYKRLDQLNISYYIPSVKGLTNTIAFIDKTTITLEAPLQGMDIYYTLDGSKPSKRSIKYTKPFEVYKDNTIKTIAYRGEVASEIDSAQIEKQSFFKDLTIEPTKGSLNRWVASKKFTVVEDIELPENGTFSKVSEVNMGAFKGKEHVSMVFNGYFLADVDGLYEFSTKSDDGSLVYLHDKLVVNNGGNHSAITRSGMIALKKGWHPISIKFHQGGGGGELSVWFKQPNMKKQALNTDNIAH